MLGANHISGFQLVGFCDNIIQLLQCDLTWFQHCDKATASSAKNAHDNKHCNWPQVNWCVSLSEALLLFLIDNDLETSIQFNICDLSLNVFNNSLFWPTTWTIHFCIVFCCGTDDFVLQLKQLCDKVNFAHLGKQHCSHWKCTMLLWQDLEQETNSVCCHGGFWKSRPMLVREVICCPTCDNMCCCAQTTQIAQRLFLWLTLWKVLTFKMIWIGREQQLINRKLETWHIVHFASDSAPGFRFPWRRDMTAQITKRTICCWWTKWEMLHRLSVHKECMGIENWNVNQCMHMCSFSLMTS